MNAGLRKILGESGRFLGAGVLSYGLGAGLSWLLHEVVGLSSQLAVGISLAVMLLVNFVINRMFVFRSKGTVGAGFLMFVVTSGTMRGAEYLMFLGLMKYLHLKYLMAFTLALVISNGVKFVLYRTVVFRGRDPAADTSEGAPR